MPTSQADSPGDGSAPAGCPRCGGDLIDGALGLPVLGQARFSYNLMGKAIETNVNAQMCERCGYIDLTAEDPERIRRADGAMRRARGPDA